MNQTPAPAGEPEPGRYEIRLKGHLDTRWSTWFGGLSLTHEGDGTTTIRGRFADQAALYGLLQQLSGLGLELVSVTGLGPGQAEKSATEPEQAPANPMRSPR